MALSATTIWEVEDGGSDTINGAAFDPGQTAGMATDGAVTLANTSAPVFTSASYNFVAGDVGAWVFIPSGTNSIPGWYKIASVAANAATLNGTIGQGVVSIGVLGSSITLGLMPSTTVGCATVASPTGLTWAIDYSQQIANRWSYTDIASAGAGQVITSVLHPFTIEQVGNCVVITGGTNLTTGRYVIASVAAGAATVIGAAAPATGVGVNGTGGLGGAYATPGMISSKVVTGNQAFIKTATYTILSASTGVATGCIGTFSSGTVEGYASIRGDLNLIGASGTRPTMIASGISSFTLIAISTSSSAGRNLILDGASLTTSRGFSGALATNVLSQNCTNSGFLSVGVATRCVATGCSTSAAAMVTGVAIDCVSYNNTNVGISTSSAVNCISYNNSGATSDGIASAGNAVLGNNVCYNNGRDGIRSTVGATITNNIVEGNAGIGINSIGAKSILMNNAGYNNTGGNVIFTGGTGIANSGFVSLSASPFVNAGSGNFALNTTASAGVLCRAGGYPGIYPVGLTTGYLDIGAVQHADPAGGIISIVGDW